MANIQSIFAVAEDKGIINHSKFNHKQNKLFNDIIRCKTKEMGFNTDVCDSCGDVEIHYNSCKNPACPMCQSVNKEVWIAKQKYYTLNIKYFHVVFTIPSELNKLVLIHPALMYQILFETASATIKELSEDKKYLGCKVGFTSVLHTWGQNLSLHPHLHLIVSGGGIDSLGGFKYSKKKFFIPVKVMSKLFKGKFLAKVKEKFDSSKCDDFKTIIDSCYEKDWIVYTKKPFKNPKCVIEYLGRYTHRIAISNGRIVSHDDNTVTFKYKDYKDSNKLKEMTLTIEEFIRRFMLHVLPQNFMKIRHYGFLTNRNKKEKIKELRILTNTEDPGELIIDYIAIISKILKRDVTICQCCGSQRHSPKLE